ncbi:MAG: hypothetical protein K2M07_05115 [Muribaculaceae bacterium]|nr:hypothetical protein [Muribaculaceae bacterium]
MGNPIRLTDKTGLSPVLDSEKKDQFKLCQVIENFDNNSSATNNNQQTETNTDNSSGNTSANATESTNSVTSTVEGIWNSTLARIGIGDIVAVTGTFNSCVGIGSSQRIELGIVTRGTDAGNIYVAVSPGIIGGIGADASVGIVNYNVIGSVDCVSTGVIESSLRSDGEAYNKASVSASYGASFNYFRIGGEVGASCAIVDNPASSQYGKNVLVVSHGGSIGFGTGGVSIGISNTFLLLK